MRRKSLLLYVLVVLTALASTGCSKYKEIRLENLAVKKVSMSHITSLNLQVEATVFNPMTKPVEISAANGIILFEGSRLATFTMLDPIAFEGNSATSSQLAEVLVTLTNMKHLFSGNNIELGDELLTQMVVDIDATVKLGNVKKVLHYEDIPLETLMKIATNEPLQ